MKNINEAWKIVSRLDAMTKGGIKKVKWTDIYSSEDELINDLKKWKFLHLASHRSQV